MNIKSFCAIGLAALVLIAVGLYVYSSIEVVTVPTPSPLPSLTPTPTGIPPVTTPTATPSPESPVLQPLCYSNDACSSACRLYLGEPYGEENDSGMLGCYAGSYFSCLCFNRQTQYKFGEGTVVGKFLVNGKDAPQIRQCVKGDFSVPNKKMAYGDWREVYNIASTYDAFDWNFLFSSRYYQCPNVLASGSGGPEIEINHRCAKAWCEGELNAAS